MTSTILVCVPLPESEALPAEEVNGFIELALVEAEEKKIRGQGVTPFLLSRISELSRGRSLRANLALLRSNARIAAQIANHLI